MRRREFEVARALSEAGDGRASGTTSENALELRRTTLLAEMREALDTTRTRRTTIAAALENVRIQLLRIGAGIGTPNDMHEEVATLSALAENDASAPAASAVRAVSVAS
jgi:hypothetical protein